MTYPSSDTEEAKKVRFQVYERDDWRCQNPTCKQPLAPLNAHHVKYRSHRGPTTPENMVSLCWKCHEDLHNGKFSVSVDLSAGEPRFHFETRTESKCTAAR